MTVPGNRGKNRHASTQSKISKLIANYRRSRDPEEQCQTCANFSVIKGFGTCQIVSGDINPRFVSDFWTPDFFPTFEYEGQQGSLTRI